MRLFKKHKTKAEPLYLHNPWLNELYPRRASRLEEAVIIAALLALMGLVVFLILGWVRSWP